MPPQDDMDVPPDTDVLGASVIIKIRSNAVKKEMKAYNDALLHAIRVSRDALWNHLSQQEPGASVLDLSGDFATNLADIWAARFRWATPRDQSGLVDYIGTLLAGSGWSVVPEGTSQPNPRDKEKLRKGVVIRVRRDDTT